MSLKITEEEKNAYQTIVRCCIHPNLQPQLNDFFDQLLDYSQDKNYFSTFNYVIEYFQKNQFHCLRFFDWKQDVQDLESFIKTALKTHFETTISLPNAEKYGEDASISADHVFDDYDESLRSFGLQLGFIDTESDEYIIMIHKTTDIDEIEQAVNSIGFDYFEV